MDSVFAFKGRDFVILVADSYANYSIMRLQDEEKKINELDGNKLMAIAGDIADRHQFGNYIVKNVHLFRIRHGVPLSVKAAASFTRSELSRAIREAPVQIDVLLGGVDEVEGPQLYWLDFLGSMVSIEKAAHGYASSFLLGLLDRHYRPDLTEAEAFHIVELCTKELRDRYLLSQTKFTVKLVKKDGIKVVPFENMKCGDAS